MSSQPLHHALLRPAVIHILRASGFHSTRPSVIETLTDLCARYLVLLATRTAQFAYDRTSTALPTDDLARTQALPDWHSEDDSVPCSELDRASPTISDVRMALTSVAAFASSLTSTEEAWHEILRKPLSALPAVAQEKERRRRDAEDTKDVRELTDWIAGPVNREIRRIAGLLIEEQSSGAPGAIGSSTSGALLADLAGAEKEDYLAVLKKKHSKTGDRARYAGTALGSGNEDKGVTKLEGGPGAILEFNSRKRRFDEVDPNTHATQATQAGNSLLAGV